MAADSPAAPGGLAADSAAALATAPAADPAAALATNPAADPTAGLAADPAAAVDEYLCGSTLLPAPLPRA